MEAEVESLESRVAGGYAEVSALGLRWRRLGDGAAVELELEGRTGSLQ